MEQTVMVFIVVGLAAGYIARVFYKKFRPGKSGSCGCGCTGCSESADRTKPAGGPCDIESFR